MSSQVKHESQNSDYRIRENPIVQLSQEDSDKEHGFSEVQEKRASEEKSSLKFELKTQGSATYERSVTVSALQKRQHTNVQLSNEYESNG